MLLHILDIIFITMWRMCNLFFIMVAIWSRAHHYIFALSFVMVALCNRADHYNFAL